MNDTKKLIKKMKETLLELLKDEEAKEKNVKKVSNTPEADYFMNLYREAETTTLKERLTKIKKDSLTIKNKIIKKIKR